MQSCAIIDDDLFFAQQLVKCLEKTSLFTYPGIYSTGTKAIESLLIEPVSFLFLDYQLPDMNGTTLLNKLQPGSAVIMLTVHRDPAVECFNIDCIVDYLVKPFNYERLLKAINRGRNYLSDSSNTKLTSHDPSQNNHEYIYFKSGRKNFRFLISDIYYAQAFGPYIKIFSQQGVSVVDGWLSNLEEFLPKCDFLRIHKSYIININHIIQVNTAYIKMPDIELPIGMVFRSNVKKVLSSSETLVIDFKKKHNQKKSLRQ